MRTLVRSILCRNTCFSAQTERRRERGPRYTPSPTSSLLRCCVVGVGGLWPDTASQMRRRDVEGGVSADNVAPSLPTAMAWRQGVCEGSARLGEKREVTLQSGPHHHWENFKSARHLLSDKRISIDIKSMQSTPTRSAKATEGSSKD